MRDHYLSFSGTVNRPISLAGITRSSSPQDLAKNLKFAATSKERIQDSVQFTGMNDQYQEVIDYLLRQLPMFQRQGPMAFKKDLTNILALSDALDNPHRQFPAIHIAGTNGKGSTAHMLSAILQAMGFRVGLYTSPHYRDFRERIKIDGQLISRNEVISFVERCRPLFEQIQPSFFEIGVAMAFRHFADQQVDIAVVETGLGGRLDSTNIITPLLSVITNISFDHEQFLGNTLPAIAGEKAGIIKPGIPVVIGERHLETEPVFRQKALERQSDIIFADQHYRAILQRGEVYQSTYHVTKDGQLLFRELVVNLTGAYQALNLQTVLQAVAWLPSPFSPEERELRRGLKQLKTLTNFIGRWQVLGEEPLVICDSAHNESGLRKMIFQLQSIPCRNLLIVLGMVRDKDLAKLLPLFPQSATYYFCKPKVPRGLDAAKLQEEAAGFGLKGQAYGSVGQALEKAREHAMRNDVIFVGGSTFVVAEVI